jgi:hypothetical protein
VGVALDDIGNRIVQLFCHANSAGFLPYPRRAESAALATILLHLELLLTPVEIRKSVHIQPIRIKEDMKKDSDWSDSFGKQQTSVTPNWIPKTGELVRFSVNHIRTSKAMQKLKRE